MSRLVRNVDSRVLLGRCLDCPEEWDEDAESAWRHTRETGHETQVTKTVWINYNKP